MAKVLLVEDDNNLREIYEARLQAEGYEISSAQDGEQALVVAKQFKPDLVISDVMMPKISGFEMLDILRNTEGLEHTRVIMLTALGQAEDKTRADSLGADRYLVKSQVTLEDIVKSAHEILDGDTAPAAPASPDATAQTAASVGSVDVVAAPQMTTAPAEPTPTNTLEAATPAPDEPAAVAPAADDTAAAEPAQPAPGVTPEISTDAPVVDQPAATSTVNTPTEPTSNIDAPSSASTPDPAAPAPDQVTADATVEESATVQSDTAVDTPVDASTVVAPTDTTASPDTQTQSTPELSTPSADSATAAPTESPAFTTEAPTVVTSADTEPVTAAQAESAVAEPGTVANEQQAVNQQIEEFIKNTDASAPVAAPDTTVSTQESADDELLAEAAESLSDSSEDSESESTPPQAAPTTTPEVAPSPAHVARQQAENDGVTIAHKKVIEPLDTFNKPDLNELLAREEAKEVGLSPTPVASSTDAVEDVPLPAHQPGEVHAPDQTTNTSDGEPKKPTDFDPHDIAL